MFGFPILEVALGLCFVYLLLSLICTSANEALAALTQRRGKMLADAITNLVGDAGLKDQIYSHPIIKSLSKGGKDLPSYISPQKFALALMDIVTGKGNSATDSTALKQGLDAIKNNGHLQQVLSTVLADSREHLKTDQQKIQDWYEDAMERVSGWYKRRTAVWIWGLALAITLLTNANTVAIFKVLWTNQAVRSSLVDAAKARSEAAGGEAMPLVEYKDPQNPQASSPVSAGEGLTPGEHALLGELMVSWPADLKALHDTDNKTSWWAMHLLGWLLTMAALSLGAPFWFDLLNKFMNIRNSGKSPAEAIAASAKGDTATTVTTTTKGASA